MKKFFANSESLLYYFLILLIPTQLGKHFWPDFAYVHGIRIDYLSPTVYLTDIFILLLFIVWIFRKLKQKSTKNSKLKTQNSKLQLKIQKYSPLLICAFVTSYLLLVIFLSDRIMGGLYSLLKLFEMAFVAYYSAKFMVSKSIFQKVIFVLSLGAIMESVIAIAQFINKGSIGGPLYFLGERFFNSGTPGIANASLNGELVLRAYGTLPHPNVLAGYLLVVMILALFSLQYRKPNQKSGIRNQELWLTKRLSPTLIHNSLFIIQIASLALGSVALFLTMSRIAILLWLAILGYYFLARAKKIAYLFVAPIIIILIFLTPLGSRFSQININEEAVVQRSILNEKAIQMISHNPLLGVGPGNFLPSLSEIQKPLSASTYLQSVHNIFLLLAAETGIIGLGLFLLFLWKTFQRLMNQESEIKNPLFIIFITILIIGMFDHYWLTLQQGQLLFALVIGLCYTPSLYGRTSR